MTRGGMSAIEKLGKVDHPLLGPGVRVRLRAWEGPDRAGEQGRYRWTGHLFPSDQDGRAAHPRHPSGYDESGNRTICVSPSCSYYEDLCRYGAFRWSQAGSLEPAP